MTSVLIACSTVDGHTLKICERMRRTLEADGHSARVEEIRDGTAIDLAQFDRIVIGASIRYGKHRPSVYDFIDRHRALLESKPSAFFTVNVVARKPEKSTPETNPYVKPFLEKSRWSPTLLGVFAGKIDYARYGFVDRLMIRFIMWMTKGPTNPSTCIEFTDWKAVDAFATNVSRMGA